VLSINERIVNIRLIGHGNLYKLQFIYVHAISRFYVCFLLYAFCCMPDEFTWGPVRGKSTGRSRHFFPGHPSSILSGIYIQVYI